MKNNYFFKRTLSAVLTLMLSSLMWATDFEVDGIAYNILSDTDVEVTRSKYEGQVVIPSTVTYEGETYSVTSIGSNAFLLCFSLTSVKIPNSVTSIGDYAFSECSSLASVEIPNSVTSIGEAAFNNCSSLASVEIPTSVTSIGDCAFYNCFSLTSIIIPNSVTSIGNSTFFQCFSLVSIEIPNSVTSIENSAFYYCSSLTSVTIPNSVTSIGDYAFEGCSSLTSVEIPNSVTSIGYLAFCKCSSLTSLEIPNGVTNIGNDAFNDCSSLTSIIVADDNPVYDSREGCNAIIETASNTLIAGCQNAVIPNSVTSIRDCAFYGCSSLASIVIPNSVTSIGDQAFSFCSSLTSVICYAEAIPDLGIYVFLLVPQSEATLYVPASSLEDYKAADQWKDFGTILPLDEDAMGITSTTAEQEADATYYTLDGVSVKNPTKKGIYIKNGKKVYIQ